MFGGASAAALAARGIHPRRAAPPAANGVRHGTMFKVFLAGQ